MKAAKQRVRAATTHKKEEERKAKETKGVSLSALKTVSKISKRKPDEKDDRPSKKVAVTPKDVPPKKSPLKSSQGAGKGVMTSSDPVIEGPCCLLTHKDYAVKEVKSFIKPTNIGPCDQLGTKDLGASALFNLARVCLLPQVKLVPSLSGSLTDACIIFRPWCLLTLFRTVVLPRRGSSVGLGSIIQTY